jgi:hypothetical protein
MAGIYELRRSDGHKCHAVHTKLHKELFSHLKDKKGGGVTCTDIQTHTDSKVISLAYFYLFKIRKVG